MLSTTTRLAVVEEIENKQEESAIVAIPSNTQTAPAAVPNNAASSDNQAAAAANTKPIAEATSAPAVVDSANVASSVNSSACSAPKSKPAGVHTKDQLLYLAKLLGFEVSAAFYIYTLFGAFENHFFLVTNIIIY